VTRVWEQIAEACQQAARPLQTVQLVAATKYVDTPMAVALARVLAERAAAVGQGQVVMLGENRPQVLRQRWEQWGDGPEVQWHLIGPLQTNKIKWVAGRVALIHSWDRFELLDKLQDHAVRQGLVCRGLLEFRISDDQSKHGFAVDDISQLVDRRHQWPNLEWCGVMGMSSLAASSLVAEEQFESLQRIFLQIGPQLPVETRTVWRELSMGMSGDLTAAIRAGSTMVRIGSALFSGLLPADRPIE
jgi:pyridoxal phosphate enzyme (YggS family)